MRTSEFESFTNDFIQYFNNSLHLTAEQIEESNKRAEKAGVDKSKIGQNAVFTGIEELGLVFFNPKSGLEMAWGITDAFPLTSNPSFDEQESEDSIMTLVTSPSLSKELALYSMEHCKKDLKFFREEDGKSIVEDIDFLMRFFKKDHYHTQPAVSLLKG